MLPRGRKHARRRPTALPQTRRAAPSARTLRRSSKLGGRSAALAQKPRKSRAKRRLVRRRSAQGSARIGTRVFFGKDGEHTAKEKSAPFPSRRTPAETRPSSTMYSRQPRQPPPSRRMHGRTATLPYCRKPSRSCNRPARKCKADAHVIGRTAKPPQRSHLAPAQRRNVCLVSEASRKRATGPAHNPPDSPPCTRAQRTSRHPQRETHFLSKRRQIHSGMESTSSPSRRCAPAKLRPTRLCNAQPSAAPTLGASSNTAARKLPINGRLWKTQSQCASAGRTAKPTRRKRPASRRKHGHAALRPPPPRPSDARAAHCTPQRHIPQRRKKRDPLTGRSLF